MTVSNQGEMGPLVLVLVLVIVLDSLDPWANAIPLLAP